MCHLHVAELQHNVCASLCDFQLGSDAANAADHVVVIAYCETLKGPVATSEKPLNFTLLLWTQSMDLTQRQRTRPRIKASAVHDTIASESSVTGMVGDVVQ